MATSGKRGSGIDEMLKMLCHASCTQLNHSPHCKAPCAIKCWKWDVSEITMNKLQHSINYGVLILNRPITHNQGFLSSLWNKASVRMTVDGGTNQWDKFVSGFPDDSKKTIKDPDLISGDFDSITDEILEKYKKKGCKIIHTPDQNRTDFTKAIMELKKYSKENALEMSHIIALAQTTGRLDQILGNIQTLFLIKEEYLLDQDTNVFIMSDDAISWLLLPGDHVIYAPEQTRKHKKAWCSLVPIGQTCKKASTTGLKWNLDNQELRFGGIVSTSNTFNGAEKVTVKCSHPLLWSMKIPMVTTP